MDALSEVLRLARFAAGVTLDAAARAPWCVSVPATPAMARAHLVIEGECFLKTGTGEAIALKTGELVPIRIGGDGVPTRWIALSVSIERHLAEPLIASLPAVMRVDLTNAAAFYWLTDALGLTLSASAAPPVGATAERSRLA